MTVWKFFAAWLFLVVLWMVLSFAWAWLRGLQHPVNSSLDTAFAGRRSLLEYAVVVAIALLMTWGAWSLASPWWSEPVAPINPARPVIIKLDPNAR